MIPIPRKELYLNKIVGNDDYDIPEKPIIEEEFFFAEILGEAVQAPEPLPRYQIYLAKIAGKDVEIPYPETRLEYFLARAAGMDVETPVPITREEIYWSNYTAIVEFELEGVPPLTYKAIEGTLENYRIYGNTVGGESVGDRTNNILPMSTTPIDTIIDDFHCEYDGMGTIKLTALTDNAVLSGFAVPLSKEFTIPLSVGQGGTGCWQINNDAAYMNVNGSSSFILELRDNTDIRDYWNLNIINRVNFDYGLMGGTNINSIKIRTVAGVATNIQSGKTLTISPAFVENVTVQVPFEPYGYKVPVTVSNGTDTLTTPIYLPEQIRKVGDEAEYIDYGEQKQHRVRKNLFNETIYNKNVEDNTLIYVPIYVGNVDYVTCSTTCPKTITGDHDPFNSRYIFILSGDVNTGAVNDVNGVSNGAPRTIQPSNGYVTICYRKVEGYDVRPWEYQTMLNVGSTPLTYEPYIENTDLDVILPAIPTLTGTNVLTVGTEVQPSKVYIKGEKGRE